MKRLILATTAVALLTAGAWAQGQPAPGTTAPGATAAPGGAAPPAVVAGPEFVKKAAISDMFEIQSSRLAAEKAKSADIKRFAEHMIKEHTASSEKLKAAAGDTPVPTQLDDKHADLLKRLQAASGAEFDRMYADIQKQAHFEAVTLFKSYAVAGDNPKLKQFAEQTLPIIEEHYSQAQKLATS